MKKMMEGNMTLVDALGGYQLVLSLAPIHLTLGVLNNHIAGHSSGH